MKLGNTKILEAIEQGRLSITPLNRDNLQPAGIDLTLCNIFAQQHIDGNLCAVWQGYEMIDGRMYLPPGAFVLGATREIVKLDNSLCANLDGRSTLGRLGIAVHVTAGNIDPGFDGPITLEIKNLGHWTVTLSEGLPIGQLWVAPVDGCSVSYQDKQAHYSAQDTHRHGPTLPKFGTTISVSTQVPSRDVPFVHGKRIYSAYSNGNLVMR